MARKVIKDLGEPLVYKNATTKWYSPDCARGKIILIEDLDLSFVDLGLLPSLKTLGDRYPFEAEVKGSQANINPRVVIITSNYCSKEIIDRSKEAEGLRLPIERRIYEEYHFAKSDDPIYFNPNAHQ